MLTTVSAGTAAFAARAPSWWQNELEERDGIAPLGLVRPDRAIPATHHERNSLDTKQDDARPKTSISPTRQGARPDVAEAPELGRGP